MYISSNPDQLAIEDFFMPFGGKPLKMNRWVKLASIMPWGHIEQIQMYDKHTHKCGDRIVSLEQPHVRPIQRGKRPNPTEFGQKLHLSVVDGSLTWNGPDHQD